MTPFPFSYFPNWANFLAIWVGYSILLLTTYCAIVGTLRWWVEKRYRSEIEDWDRMRQEAQKIREKIHDNRSN